MAHKVAITKGALTIFPDGDCDMTIVYPDETRTIRLTRQQMRQVFDSWVPIEKGLCDREQIRRNLLRGIR